VRLLLALVLLSGCALPNLNSTTADASTLTMKKTCGCAGCESCRSCCTPQSCACREVTDRR
jgi:hypothetical protein